MKGIELLLIGVMVVLVAVAVPGLSQTVYAAGNYVDIERLVPAETQEVEAGAGETHLMAIVPVAFSNDTARIELLFPSESGEIETGAGETPWVAMKPVAFSNDTARIELLLPSD